MRLDRIKSELEALQESLREQWSKLTAADLSKVSGDPNSLAAVIAKRYGISAAKAREEVKEFRSNFSTTVRDAAFAARDAATDLFRGGRNHATDAVSKGTEKASELLDAGKEKAKEFGERGLSLIQDRPLTSLAVAAGAGALLAFLLRRRN